MADDKDKGQEESKSEFTVYNGGSGPRVFMAGGGAQTIPVGGKATVELSEKEAEALRGTPGLALMDAPLKPKEGEPDPGTEQQMDNVNDEDASAQSDGEASASAEDSGRAASRRRRG
jgi:hypothetical protein